MSVVARDAALAEQLVYAWPLAIGHECEVVVGTDEHAVMCPAWTVGERLLPGRHRWRTPDPRRPALAFFVRTVPVRCTFDMTTSFALPGGPQVRLRATGALDVRCVDAPLLVAQFVGLPFHDLNAGVLRSVSRSVERMLGRLLVRRVLMTGSVASVTDPAHLGEVTHELAAYNPTAGAVFGIELVQLGDLVIAADDGASSHVTPPRPMQPVLPPPSAVPAPLQLAIVDDVTEPGLRPPLDVGDDPAMIGIGVTPIGGVPAIQDVPVSAPKPGERVRLSGPDGAAQTATVRQQLPGYCEVEVASSGERLWVPSDELQSAE